MHELRYALRMLRKSPAFAAVAMATLAVGIGANTAIFSVVDGTVLRPLDYAEPDRIVRVQTSWASEPRAGISPAEYFDYRDELDVFAAMGVYVFSSTSVTGGDRPERLRGAFVSSGVLPSLGTQPALGRVFTDEEELPGHDVAIVSQALWQRYFDSEDDVTGQSIVVNGVSRTVVGVMPEGFRLPEDFTSGRPTEIWLPLAIDRTTVLNRGSHFLAGIARLKPGVTADRAAAEVRALAARMVERYPDDYPADMRFKATTLPLADDVIGPVRPAMFMLLCAVGLLLLIACANVANLLLARAESRRGEFALRAAIGASRGRLVRQLFVECVVLAVAGGVLGIALALVCTDVLVALQPPDLPRIGSIGIDFRVVAFTAAATCLTAVLLGIMPAMQISDSRLATALHEGSTRVARGGRSLRSGLVIGEVAVALVLMIGASLLVRSYAELRAVDPGYRTEQILTTEVNLSAAAYPDAQQVTGFFSELLQRLAHIPGVTSAGAVSNLPLATRLGDLNFHIEGRDEAPDEVSPAADWQTVTPGYLSTMEITLLAGRGIAATDDADSPGVMVISEATAKRYWPGENPLGKRVLLGGDAGPGWVTVVGIVADVRHEGFDAAPRSQMYLPHAQFRFWDGGGPVRGLTLTIRTSGEPASLAAQVRREVAALDPSLPVADFRSMEQVVAASVARPKMMMLLLASFAAVAIALGAVGVYGLMAWLVGRRRREMGIRLALGARPQQVARMVLGNSLALTAAGIAIGIVIAAILARSLAGMLYGVPPLDIVSFTIVPLLLAAVALIASSVPTWRAMRVNPNVVLRHE